MNRILITAIVCLVASATFSALKAQESCDTPEMDSLTFISKPWIGNNQFLLDILDSIGYGQAAIPKSASGGFDQMAAFWIPVKAWVYNDNNGTGGIEEA